MLEVKRAGERHRGGEPHAGIDTRHAFSFAGFYDPDNLRFGPLTACNEERLAPGAGFPPHRHRDLEIVTWVIEGELTHEDTDGRTTAVRPGDVQRLTPGSGTLHGEHNRGTEPLRFLQMWLVPDEPGGAPEYEVVRGLADGTPYALPRTDAALYVHHLDTGTRTTVPDAHRAYVHVVRGAVTLHPDVTTATRLTPGDSARLTAAGTPPLRAEEPTELLIWRFGAALTR
ncbi:pirin family protein [Streptomyces sp. RFCAC02]|uniref:pirin family protein n=1 Tax=Streptomyces sp. RFCAC02 TaxID=2499143 RepID=UPI00101F38DD|nr:pirin family protein [Streptomyces sp. RFCAC02]